MCRDKISVSVIIPNHNSVVIDKVIEGLSNQSYPHEFEALAVGRDDVGKIGDAPDIKFYETPDRVSPAVARNIGLDRAKGDFILFIDADCIPDKNWMNEMVKRFKEGHGFIGGGMTFLKNGYWQLSDNISWFYSSHVSLKEGDSVGVCVPTANMGISKSLMEKVGGFDTTLPCGEDIDLMVKLKLLKEKPYFVPQAYVYHCPPRTRFKDLIRHASSWGRDSIIMRRRFREVLSTPLLLRNRLLLFIFSPIISFLVTLKIFLHVKALRRFLHTFPAVFISKLVWCYSGWYRLGNEK